MLKTFADLSDGIFGDYSIRRYTLGHDLVEIIDGGDYTGLRLKVIQTTYMPNGSMQGGDEPHILVGLGVETNGTPLRHTIIFINECALQSV